MRADIRTLTSAPATILTQPIPPSLSITSTVDTEEEETLPPLRRPHAAPFGTEVRGNGGYRPILGMLPVTIRRSPAQVDQTHMYIDPNNKCDYRPNP